MMSPPHGVQVFALTLNPFTPPGSLRVKFMQVSHIMFPHISGIMIVLLMCPASQ